MSIKNLTMKSEYAFRVIHHSHIRKMRRKYQNSSLTKKLAWRADIKKMSAQFEELKKANPDIYNEDGSINIFGVANRAKKEQQ